MDYILEFWKSSGALAQLLAILAVIVGFKMGFIKIKTKWFTVGKDREEPKNKEEIKKGDGSKMSDHESCPKFEYFKKLNREMLQNNTKSVELRYDTKEAQTRIAEEFVDEVIDKFKGNYLTLYRPFNDNKISGLLKLENVKDYYCMTEKLSKELNRLLREAIDRNHLAEQNEEEYREYITKKIKKYKRFMTEFYNEHYDTDDFKISREDLYESQIQLLGDISVKTSEFFYRIRNMAQETMGKIEAIEQSIEPLI